MREEVKVHFLIAGRDTRPPCGMVGDSPHHATTFPANVTCFLCMRSRVFKKAAPDLATQDARSHVYREVFRSRGIDR